MDIEVLPVIWSETDCCFLKNEDILDFFSSLKKMFYETFLKIINVE
jgi:hypothetical protein